MSETTGFFVELVGILTTEGTDLAKAYFNTGFTWEMRPMTQLDGGLRTGLTGASVDLMPFLGISTKF